MDNAENKAVSLDDIAASVAGISDQLTGINKSSADNAREIETINGVISGMKSELAALQQGQAKIPAPLTAAKSVGEQFVSNADYKALKSQLLSNRIATKHSGVSLELTAAPETTQASNSVSRTSFAPPTELGMVTDPRKVLNIESLFGHIVIGGNSYQYVKYGYTTTVTATGPAIVAEGAAKPESNYAGSIVTGTIKTIAHWTKMTEQMMQDDSNLVSFINSDMQYQLDKVVDHQLIRGTGSGQLTGLNQSGNYADYITGAGLVSGDTVIDLILKVKTCMEAANISNIALLLNPTDWCKVLCSKNVNKDYLIQGILDVPTQRIWGIPVILNGSVESGKFHMGNFYEGGKVIERSPIAVEIDREGDDFIKNLMTLRVERRLDFAVVQPKALAYGNFENVS